MAPVISRWLHGTADPKKLTPEQKDMVAAITRALGAAVGGGSANVVQGSLNADSAVGNNNGALRALDKTMYVMIPAFGALYCSLDKQCHNASGVFVGMLADLIERDREIDAENQRQLEQIKNGI